MAKPRSPTLEQKDHVLLLSRAIDNTINTLCNINPRPLSLFNIFVHDTQTVHIISADIMSWHMT